MSLVALQRIRDRFEVPSQMYLEMGRDLRLGIQGSSRLRGRALLGVWESLLEMQLGRVHVELQLPPGIGLGELRSRVRSFTVKVAWSKPRGGQRT